MSYDTTFKKKQQVDDIEAESLSVPPPILNILGPPNPVRIQIADPVHRASALLFQLPAERSREVGKTRFFI